jgi:hypothetical protein
MNIINVVSTAMKDSSHMLNENLTLATIHRQAKIKRLLSEVTPTYLSVTWGISKARDSYGYNRVQIIDTNTSKRFSACGGGYDMLGSAFGEWLQKTHQDLLMCYSAMAHDICEQQDTKQWLRYGNKDGLYGMTLYVRDGNEISVSLDGGCGLDCMIKIARSIGLTVDPVKTYSRKGQCSGVVGWHVSTKAKQEYKA